MPIGKNAIKRVTNNGYSNVKTEAPDMENSTVIEEKPKEAEAPKVKKTSAPKKKAEPKAKEPKSAKAPKKSMETEPDLAPLKTLEKVLEKSNEQKPRQGEGYVNLGGELPYYLL